MDGRRPGAASMTGTRALVARHPARDVSSERCPGMLPAVRWGFRALVVIIAAVTVAGVSVAAAAPRRLDAKFDRLKPCQYVTAKQVQKVFGGPVTVDPSHPGLTTFVANDCSFIVGTATQPMGVLLVVKRYPYFQQPGQTAVDVLESSRASDSLAGLTDEDGGIGTTSYFGIDHSMLSVAPNKNFAFGLQWLAPGAPADGGRLDAATRHRLTTLARVIVKAAR